MVFGYRTAQKQLKLDANDNREAIMYITQSAEIASLERDLVAANKKIEKRDAEIEELKAKYEKLQAETAGKKAETEACDFADAAARDAIDALRVNQSPFS